MGSDRLRGADQTYFFRTIPEEGHLHPRSGKRERVPAKSGPDPHPPAYVHHPDTGKTLHEVFLMPPGKPGFWKKYLLQHVLLVKLFSD